MLEHAFNYAPFLAAARFYLVHGIKAVAAADAIALVPGSFDEKEKTFLPTDRAAVVNEILKRGRSGVSFADPRQHSAKCARSFRNR